MPKLYTISLDLYGDDPEEWAAGHGCVAVHDDSRRWMDFTITGTYGNIAALLHDYFVEQMGSDLTELHENLVEMVKEA